MAHGYDLKKPKFKNIFISLRIDEDDMALINKVATKLKVKRSDFLNHAIKKELSIAASQLFR